MINSGHAIKIALEKENRFTDPAKFIRRQRLYSRKSLIASLIVSTYFEVDRFFSLLDSLDNTGAGLFNVCDRVALATRRQCVFLQIDTSGRRLWSMDYQPQAWPS